MKLRDWLRTLFGFGTSEGVRREWDTRRLQHPPELSAEEKLSRSGRGAWEIRDGIQVYYPTFSEAATHGMNLHAIIAGRNRLTSHGTSHGTIWKYQGQRFQTPDADEAVSWAVHQHVVRQQARQSPFMGERYRAS